MSMTDPIADLLTRIRTAQMATDETVEMPFSKAKAEIVKILEEEGYIFGHTVTHSKPFSTLTSRWRTFAGVIVALLYLIAHRLALLAIRCEYES